MSNAVVMTGIGPPEVLQWAQVGLPERGEGQIRIKVKAASVSPAGAHLADDAKLTPLLPPALI